MGRAVSLPVAAGGTVTLLHVVSSSLPARSRREAEKFARTALANEALHASDALGPDVTVKQTVAVGAPAQKLVEVASRVKADLIVMGRGVGRPLRDSFLGSTAERVIRQGRIPVLVVRLPARGPYRRPTLGLDLDQTAEAVLRMLFRVIPPPRPRAVIVHAHDAPYLGMVHARLSEDEREEDEHRYRQRAAVQLAQIVARAAHGQTGATNDGPEFTTHVRFGDPRRVIKAAVKKLDTDLLLLGTHGYTGAAQLFLGTVAGEVLREVRCDVLVVPPRRPPTRRG